MSKRMCEKWQGAIFTLNLLVNGSLVPRLTDTINFKLYLHYLRVYIRAEVFYSTRSSRSRLPTPKAEWGGPHFAMSTFPDKSYSVLGRNIFLIIFSPAAPPLTWQIRRVTKKNDCRGKNPLKCSRTFDFYRLCEQRAITELCHNKKHFEFMFLHFPNNKMQRGPFLARWLACPTLQQWQVHCVSLCLVSTLPKPYSAI